MISCLQAWRLPVVTGLLVVAMGGMAVGRARADSDLVKVLAGVAVGALVYEALDHDDDCHRYTPAPRYRYAPPPPRPYGPSPRQAYRAGYNDGYDDGRHDGRREGYRVGYRDGRDDDRGRGRSIPKYRR